MTDAGALAARVREWIAGDPDPETRRELQALLDANDLTTLAGRFRNRLGFGTAGLRGPLGGGPNRMNTAVVRRASWALARWMHAHGVAARGVVVGHDHRHGSAGFARDTAAVLAAAGVPVRLASGAWPTPVTAHAVRRGGAGAGVMVTASHNPAPDNGYKVYDATGSQIVPPDDAEIAAGIDTAGPAASIPYDPASPRIEPLGREAVEEYLADVLGSVPVPAAARDLRVVYTPLHGVGLGVLREMWERAGLRDPVVVAEQAEPDPDFPTAPFPNPEEPGVLELALDLARRRRADLVLANDPDADRLAVAVPDGRDWRVLTGDELGVLLGDHVLATTAGDDRVVARSVVSSSMLDRVAAAHGVPARVTLPGFKWVSRAGDADGRRLVFGYEEALGYGVTPVVRDKDGLSAALGVVALAAREHLTDALARLTAAHGVHVSGQWSVRFADADAAAAFVAAIRARPPRELAGTPVSGVRDHRDGAAGLPPADLLALELADGGQALVRPSGTEPKVKCYFEVVRADGDERRARERLDALRRSFAAQFGASGG